MPSRPNDSSLPGVDISMLKTEERILYAAIKVFANHEFGSASIRMIAKEAGVTLSSVMYHYQSKEHLYEAVFERVMQLHGKTLRPYFATIRKEKSISPERARALIEGMIGDIIDSIYQTPEKPDLSKMIFMEYYYPSPFYKTFYDRYFKKNYDILIDLIMIFTGVEDRHRATLLAVSISGLFVGFRMEREFLRYSIGLAGYSREEAKEIKELTLRNIFVILEAETKDRV